jgi:RNA-directed DNA polymerase
VVRTTKNRSIPAKAGTTCIHRKRQRQDATVRHPIIEDRIVQQALRMLMDPILGADFYTCSHGFRRNRSTHTALRDVARMYPRTTWTIEAEPMGCFDNIPHGQLMKAVEKRIADGRILKIIRKFLAAGHMEQWQDHKTYSGTPQGGVLSTGCREKLSKIV